MVSSYVENLLTDLLFHPINTYPSVYRAPDIASRSSPDSDTRASGENMKVGQGDDKVLDTGLI